MKNIAVIDCGSNSFRMLIASLSSQHFEVIKREYKMVMLGKSLSSNGGVIDEESFNRGINALVEFQRIMEKYNCQEYHCIGTSTIRTATNSNKFIKAAKELANIEIQITSEQDEAKYTFFGALGVADDKNQYAVLDIGGGSSEFIYFDNRKVSSHSMLLGAARLKNMFWPNKNTPSEYEYKRATEYAMKKIEEESISVVDKTLIGVAGTITTLAAIEKELIEYSPQEINNTILSLKNIKSMLLYIMRLDEEKRSSVAGMFPPERANNIIAGIVILMEMMKALDFDEIKVKSTCILEGLILIKYFSNSIDK